MVRFTAAVCVALFGTAGVAEAQSAPPIQGAVTQGAQIERSIDRLAGAEGVRGPEEGLPGEAGVFVLKKQDIYFVSAESGLGYSGNPLRTSDDVGGSGFWIGQLSTGIRTRLAGVVDFSAAINMDSTRYFENFAPSNAVVSGNVSLGSPVAHTPFYVGVSGFKGANFDRDFGRPVEFHGGSAFFTGAFKLAPRLLLQPSVAVTRQWTAIEENDNTAVSARLVASSTFHRIGLSAYIGVSRVWFDNFYEDVTFVERRDLQYEAGVSAAYALTPRIQLTARAAYVRRDSTFFLASYESGEAAGSIGLVYRF